MAGSLLIVFGGFLTAIWKLLYTIGVGDYQLLRNFQFAFAAPGFVLLFIAVLRLASAESEEKEARYVSMLMMAIWKIPLLIVMTLASMGMQSILAFIAARFNAKVASVGFIVAFLCLVSMGAMASGEQTLARQWVEQSVNTVGQLGFMLGCILLYQKTAFVY
jgi:hypothetical protein